MGQYIKPINTDYLKLSGGTVSGDTYFSQNLSASTIYGDGSNLTGIHDYYVTGGSNTGYVVTLSRNDGVNVSFYLTSFVAQLSGDTFTTGGTFVNNQLSFLTSGGIAYSVPIEHFSGITVDYLLTAATLYGTTLSAGTLISGATNLYDIFDVKGSEDITRLQPGLNTYTGGTDNKPYINISAASLNNLSVSGLSQLTTISTTTLSAGTFISGTTNLYNIFQTIGSDLNKTYVQSGLNIYTGGTVDNPSINVSSATLNNLSVSGTSQLTTISTTILSAGTFISGATNLYDIFDVKGSEDITRLQPGLNTYTGGTANKPYVNISAASLNNLSVSGTSQLTTISTTILSAGTLISGATNLYDIFSTPSQNNSLYVYKSGDTMTGALLINNSLAVTGTSSLQTTSAVTIVLDAVKIITKNNIILSGDVLIGGTW